MTKDERELLDAWRLNGYFQGDGGIVMDKALTRKVDLLIDRLARVEEASKALVESCGAFLGDERDSTFNRTTFHPCERDWHALRAALDGKKAPT